MTVRDTYKKGEGKEYTVLSQSGSGIVLRFGLKPLLDNEKSINKPGNVEKSWFTSANYEMKLKAGGVQKLNGRDCYVLAVTAKRKAPNTINGTLWVDARDGRNRADRWHRVQEPFGFFGNDAHDAPIYAVAAAFRWPRMRARSRTACSLGGRW